VKSKSLGTSDPRLADLHLQRAKRAEGFEPDGGQATSDPGEALRQYLAERALTVRRTSLSADEQKLTPLVKRWRRIPMGSWTRPMLVAYIGEHNWSPRTIQMLVGASKRFIRWARDVGIPMQDFVGDFRGPKVRYREPPHLPAKQLRKVLAKAKGHKYLELPVALAGLAGLSHSDVRALDWSEVDLKRGVITRERSKTGQPIRVDIGPTLREILVRHRHKTGPVCRRLPKTDPPFNRAVHKLFEAAGVPAAPRGQNGLHRLRHTFATLMGGDVATKARALAHRPGSVVTLRYIHSDDDSVREGVYALDRRVAEA
jgi:integrase